MSNNTYELREFTAESKFTWNIKNFSKIDWKKKFVVKSEEVMFKEANVRWWLKLSPMPLNGVFDLICTTFYVRDKTFGIYDENARFKFDITLKDGSNIESFTMPINPRSKVVFEYSMTKYIPVAGADTIELIPRVTCETLKFYPEVKVEVPKIQEDDFDHLSDLGCKKCDENEKLGICASDVDDLSESDSDDSICCDTPNSNEKIMRIAEMDDIELATLISRIHLNNMKHVADTSGNLLISAVKNNHKVLITDCSKSLASQMNSKNFMDIWDIAEKLEIDELKKHVIQYVVNNRGNIRYDGRMSPELMREVVKAMD